MTILSSNSFIFGLRNHNTTMCNSYKLANTYHFDCTGGISSAGGNSQPAQSTGPYSATATLTSSTTTPMKPTNNTTSRSVSWNSSGTYLAVASSCSTVRLWNIETAGTSLTTSTNPSGITTVTTNPTLSENTTDSHQQIQLSGKEVLTITGHTGPVTKVRFHPMDNNTVCSGAIDGTVQLWDVRNASQRNTGKIDVLTGKNSSPIAIEWCGHNHQHILQVTECDGSIYIYDIRKLSSPSLSSAGGGAMSSHPIQQRGSGGSNPALRTFRMTTEPTSQRHYYIETCLFTPDGDHLITGSTYRGEGIGELRVFLWNVNNNSTKTTNTNNKRKRETNQLHNYNYSQKDYVAAYCNNTSSSSINADTTTARTSTTTSSTASIIPCQTYSAHAGPIYAMAYSPNGQYLATGGSDATVCLWDVQSMCCTKAITRRTKFIRSVAFSSNNHILAISTEEDTIDLTNARTGELIGLANFTTSTSSISGSSNLATLGRSNMRGTEGAEEITFHPNPDQYLLACSRTDTGPMPMAPVTILKLNISKQ